jgi:vitamin B12 transporter
MQTLHPLHLPRLCPILLWVFAATGIAHAQAMPAVSGPGKPSAASPTPARTGANKTATAVTPTPQSPQAATPPPPTNKTQAQTSTILLPRIVVTAATREAQSPDTTAATTTVLTHQYLEDSRFVDVASALQFVPGTSTVVSGMQGGQTSVFIHGLDSNQTLVTIDGRRQAGGLSGADDNLANLTLDDVDQIEIVRTPVSSTDGGGAMGGVINLVTLSGRGLTQPISSVSFEGGSFNSYRENIQSRGAVGDFDYAVSATRQDAIFPSLSPGDPAFGSPGFTGQADQYRNTTYRGNFGYQLSPEVYVDLHTAYNNAYTSSPGEYVTPDPTANLLIEDWNISPEVVAKVTDFYSTKLYYTRDQQRQAYNDPYNLDMALAFGYSPQGDVTRLQLNTDSIDWQNDFQIAHNWLLTAGLQGDNRNYYEYDNGLGALTFDGHDDNIGGFLSSQWQPIEGLNVLNSVRYDAYSQFGDAFTWRQGVSYIIAPTKTVVHASGSQAFTEPPLQDLVVDYPGSFGSPSYLSNPNLKPETDLGWEAGVEQPFLDGRLTPSATYFHNDIHGEIEDALQPDGNFMEENVDRATTDGVEIGLKVNPISTIAVNLGYTYLNATDDETQMRLVRRPRNTLVFSGTWNPIPALTFTLGGNWILGRQDIEVVSPYGQEDAPDYFVLRASANYRLNDHVTLWLRGENLTDHSYQPVLGYYAASIAAYGGIKISF